MKKIFKKLTSLMLSLMLILAVFGMNKVSYANEKLNGIHATDEIQVIEIPINAYDREGRLLPNFMSVMIKGDRNRVSFTFRNVGADKVDSLSLSLKIVDANGKVVYKPITIKKAALKIGDTPLGTYNKAITTVQEDITVTGTVTEGKTFVVNQKTWRGNFAGGKYSSLSALGGHRHHIPAKGSLSGVVSESNGPAIRMTIDDHKRTASYGSSTSAKEYRAKQASLIKAGKFRQAQDMDINDIKNKFGSKYNGAINEAIAYTKKLGLR